jgi:alpha-1,3-rhamnosyl/mannosyltransferase
VSARRVGLNLLWLVPGVVGGTEDAVCGFLAELARQRPDDLDITLYVQRGFVHEHADLVASFPCRVLPIGGGHKATRVLSEIVWLGAWARRDRLELVHHYGGVVPPLATVPSVVTIHDVQPLVFPENFDRVKRRWLGTMLPRSVRAARLVIVPSRAARDSLIELTGASPAKLRVVWHGVSLRQRRHPSARERAAVRSAYRLDGPYVLYPAITYPHKNHALLLDAFALVAAERPDVTLVLAGSAGSEEATVAATIERLGLGDRVRRVGRVSRGDLDVLLLDATVLAFPSRFEGFGLPLIEAMAVGCPVVAARASAIPEVVGDAGRLVAPDDPAGFAAAIQGLLDDSPERREVIARAQVRVLRFAWRELCGVVTDIYREALGETPGSAVPPPQESSSAAGAPTEKQEAAS